MEKGTAVLQENVKDIRAREWLEKLRTADKKPEQVVGEFIAGGARLVNYVDTEEKRWKPAVGGEQRKMILLGGYIYGNRMGAEGLKSGLSFKTSVEASRSFGTNSLWLVPYPRFTPAGEIDTPHSQIFLLSEKQVEDLEKLVGLTR